jgi:methylmalonyl-CoA mutase
VVLCHLQAWESEEYCKERLGLDSALGAIDRAKLNVNGSSLAAGHLTLVPALRDALADAGRPDIMIVVGGVIPPGDFDELYAAGATAIYPPGTVIAEAAVSLLNKLAGRLGYDLS